MASKSIIGWPNASSMPVTRRSFTEGARTAGTPAKSTTIRPGQYPDGQDIMGTPAANVHPVTKTRYLDKSAKAMRADLRGGGAPKDNAKVHSKGMANAAKSGFKPSDPRQGKLPAKLEVRDLPGAIMAQSVKPPGIRAPEVVGFIPNGNYAYKDASHVNSGRQTPEHRHIPGKGTTGAKGMATK